MAGHRILSYFDVSLHALLLVLELGDILLSLLGGFGLRGQAHIQILDLAFQRLILGHESHICLFLPLAHLQ